MASTVNCGNGTTISFNTPFLIDTDETFHISSYSANYKSYLITCTFPSGGAIFKEQVLASGEMPWTSQSSYVSKNVSFKIPKAAYNGISPGTNSSNEFYVTFLLTGGTAGRFSTQKRFTLQAPPPVMTCSVTDTNSASVTLTGNKNKLIRYVSTALASVSAVAWERATVTNVSVNGTSVGTDKGSLELKNVSVDAFDFYAEDSTGAISKKTLRPEIVQYVPLTVSGSEVRPQPTQNAVNVSVSGNYWAGSFGAAANTLSVKWSCTNGQNGTLTPTTADGKWTGKITLSADYRYAYDLTLTATDKVGTVTQSVHINQGLPVFDWGKSSFRVNVPLLAPGGVTGDLTGNASTASKLGTANVGSAGVPIFLSGGVPKAVTPETVRTSIGAASAWKVLWKNGSPTAAFGAQTLTITGLNTCDLFIVTCMYASSTGNSNSGAIYVPSSGAACNVLNVGLVSAESNTVRAVNRTFTFNVAANQVVVSNGYYHTTSNAGTSTSNAVPLYILGTKI